MARSRIGTHNCGLRGASRLVHTKGMSYTARLLGHRAPMARSPNAEKIVLIAMSAAIQSRRAVEVRDAAIDRLFLVTPSRRLLTEPIDLVEWEEEAST